MKVGSFGVQGARELLIMNHPLVREAIHSDFLTVYTQPSLLPVPEIGEFEFELDTKCAGLSMWVYYYYTRIISLSIILRLFNRTGGICQAFNKGR